MTAHDPLPANAIEVRGLEKTYAGSKKAPPKTALRGVDLVIPRGSMFGLLGPNGAGKSTLINILAGVVNKTGGTAAIWGRDIDKQPRDARAALGVVPQEIVADVFFTPREALEVQAGFYGVPAVLLTTPARMLIRVDLPAPLGPSRPNIEPRGMTRSTPRRATLGGAFFEPA